jgi:uncharacterized protein YkwD/putative cell wall-binding protein
MPTSLTRHARTRPVVLLRILTALLTAAAIVGAVPVSAGAAQDLTAEQQFVSLVNAERNSLTLPSLRPVKDVRDVAYAWSTVMASERRMYHNPNYYNQFCCWTRAAENVGWTTVSDPNDPAAVKEAVERLHKAFMDSDGHRANIMNPLFDHVGIGVEVRENSCPGGAYYTACLWATENFRQWDGTEPNGGVQDPYAGTKGSTTTATVSDAIRPGGFDGNVRTIERLGKTGSAAIQTSQARFGTDAASHAMLTRDDIFVDALSGTPLAGDGPILFTPSGSLSDAVRAELQRALPKGGTVYLLGGENSLTPAIVDAVRAAGLTPVRLSGPSRVSTATAIASEVRRLYGDNGKVAVARAWGTTADPNGPAAWVDSITGGAWAAANQVPVLVSASATLSPEAAAWLVSDAPASTVLLGGEVSLSQAVAAVVPSPKRVSGPERTSTAAAVSQSLWHIGSSSSGRRFIAIDGWAREGWQAGLAAAGLSADTGAPVLLVNADPAVRPEASRQLLAACGSPAVDVLMLGNLSDSVAGWIEGADGSSC